MQLLVLPDRLSVCQMPAASAWPVPAADSIFSVTRTSDELSIVCTSDAVPAGNHVRVEPDWRALQVVGPLDFSLVGILASLLAPLAEAAVSVFALSTYDTDYILVRGESLTSAIDTLQAAGHDVRVS